jgi:flotillin
MQNQEYRVEVAEVPQSSPVVSQVGNNGSVGGGVAIAVLIFAILIAIWGVNALVQICDPNKILIISGRKYKRPDGQVLGYRVIYGGRTFRVPILETVKTMELTTMPVPIEVTNAYAKGGTPLDIQAIANVKIARNENLVGNAIERFLGRGLRKSPELLEKLWKATCEVW